MRVVTLQSGQEAKDGLFFFSQASLISLFLSPSAYPLPSVSPTLSPSTWKNSSGRNVIQGEGVRGGEVWGGVELSELLYAITLMEMDVGRNHLAHQRERERDRE